MTNRLSKQARVTGHVEAVVVYMVGAFVIRHAGSHRPAVALHTLTWFCDLRRLRVCAKRENLLSTFVCGTLVLS